MISMRYRLHKLLFQPVGSTKVEHLDRGPTRFDDDLHVGFLRGDIVFTRLPDAIMVHGTVDTEVTVQCVRSLEDFDLCLPVVLDDILFAIPGHPTDEPDRVVSDDGWIDLTETLREEIIMAIPINPISPKYAEADPAQTPNLAPLQAEGATGGESDWLTVKWSDADAAKSASDASETDARQDAR